MPRLTRTIHAFAADSAGNLAGATVTDTPLGTRSTLIEAIPKALELPAPRLADRLPTPRSGDAIVFVCPSEHASLRPFAVTTRHWPGAKEDVLASVGTLFPLTPDDARLGLVDLTPGDDDTPRGAIVGASASALRPWLEHLRAALGREPDAILAPAQCLGALGLQQQPRVRVLESAGAGETVEHTLAMGVLEDLAQPPAPPTDDSVYRLPGAEGPGGPTSSVAVSLPEVALAGALAPTVAHHHAAPVHGSMPSPRSRWLLPAAGLGLAALLVWGALYARDTRTNAALQRIDDQQAALSDDVQRVSALRREALAHQALLKNVIAPTLGAWNETLPDLEAARAALPDGAWLFDIEISPTQVDINGLAPEPREILRSIESSAAFTGARFVTPPSPSTQYDGELFHIVASRVSARDGGDP